MNHHSRCTCQLRSMILSMANMGRRRIAKCDQTAPMPIDNFHCRMLLGPIHECYWPSLSSFSYVFSNLKFITFSPSICLFQIIFFQFMHLILFITEKIAQNFRIEQKNQTLRNPIKSADLALIVLLYELH